MTKAVLNRVILFIELIFESHTPPPAPNTIRVNWNLLFMPIKMCISGVIHWWEMKKIEWVNQNNNSLWVIYYRGAYSKSMFTKDRFQIIFLLAIDTNGRTYKAIYRSSRAAWKLSWVDTETYNSRTVQLDVWFLYHIDIFSFSWILYQISSRKHAFWHLKSDFIICHAWI